MIQSLLVEAQAKFGNRLLDGLPAETRNALRPHLRSETLPAQMVLTEPGRPVDQVYFPVDCVVSLIAVLKDGATVEVGMAGWEGMLPICAVLSDGVPAQKAIVQITGGALAIRSADLRRQAQAYPALQRALLCYGQALLNMAAQNAACASLHLLEQRCARWLLMAHDRMRDDKIHITHEAMATMLGVRRAGVTVAAQALQSQGLIEYRHGTILVHNRKGLEGVACECYGSVTAEFARLFAAGH